jgi:tol-pal system protein YbgF
MRPVWFSFAVFTCALTASLAASTSVFAQAATNAEIRLTQLEGEVRQLNGALEQNQYQINQLKSQLERMTADVTARLQRVESGQTQPMTEIGMPTASPQPTVGPNAVDIGGRTTTPSAGVASAGTVPAVPAPVANPTAQAPAAKAPVGTPQQQYDAAFALLRQADYGAAETAFAAFLKANPNDKLADNARYWHGETLYVRGKFTEAAQSFAEGYQKNAKGEKAPDNLLKLAMSLAALDRKTEACDTLGELKKRHPNASPTLKGRAEQEGKRLGCAAPAAAPAAAAPKAAPKR